MTGQAKPRRAIHPLAAMLLLAVAIRVPLAFWPNVHHPDEVYQYLEPAWRMLGHDGIVTWEWRYGMRSWLLPALLQGPVWLGLLIDPLIGPRGIAAFVLPRICAALASLAVVAAAWGFGARISRTHAIIAAFVAAIWFELVHMAPHTLGEPLATSAIFPAVWLLTRDRPSRRALVIAGALLGFAFLLRFQYAPAIAVLVIFACWRGPMRMVSVAIGGAAVIAVGGLIDLIQGAPPLAWLFANIQQNLFNDRAAQFGVSPASAYIGHFWRMWSLAIIPLAFAIRQGWRHAPVLLWVAIANIAVHSLIGHKEYRFVFLSIALLIVIAALGSADWARMLRDRTRIGSASPALVGAAWLAATLVLGLTGTMPAFWQSGVGASRLTTVAAADPAICGLGMDDVPFYLLPGSSRLPRVPLYAIDPDDPLAAKNSRQLLPRASPAFNRILADASASLPPAYRKTNCDMVGDANICLFARPGGCSPAAAAPLRINAVLRRIDR